MKSRPAHRQRGHVEIVPRRGAPEREQPFVADPELERVAGEVTRQHFLGKMVVSGWNRGVGGKDGVDRDRLQSALEIESRLAQHANTLENEKRGVSLIHVPDSRLEPELRERAHATDAENDLLLDAHGPIAAVEPIGDAAIAIIVLGHVGIEQIEPDPADGGAPNPQRDAAPRKLDTYPQIGAAVSGDQIHRKLREVRVGVGRALIAVVIDGLGKIALTVEQADSDRKSTRLNS